MRILNRPMFKYGGPIKEGVMHGMRNNYQSGQLVKPGPGRPGYQGFPGVTGGYDTAYNVKNVKTNIDAATKASKSRIYLTKVKVFLKNLYGVNEVLNIFLKEKYLKLQKELPDGLVKLLQALVQDSL